MILWGWGWGVVGGWVAFIMTSALTSTMRRRLLCTQRFAAYILLGFRVQGFHHMLHKNA